MRRIRSLLALLVAFALGSCGGSEATIVFALVFPQGEDRLPEGTVLARMTLDDPPSVVEAPVAADGSFELALEIPAENAAGRIVFEALDAGGEVLARGESAPLPLALYEGRFFLFVAPPGQFAIGPEPLDPARGEIAAVALEFGFLVVGGRDEGGARRSEVGAYSIYLHSFTSGEPLPEARSDVTAAVGAFGAVYLFGGVGLGDAPSSALEKFDTNVPPDGEYTQLASDGALARAGAQAAPLGGERFVVTGDPVALLDGAEGRIAPMDASTPQARAATTATTTADAGGEIHVVLVGPAGVTIYRSAQDRFDDLDPAMGARAEHAAIALPGGDVLAVGGIDPASALPSVDALRVTPAANATSVPLLARPRRAPALALAGDDVLVVAGGYDAAGAPLDDAELFDATTLAPLGTTPLAIPRGGATALRLVNRAVLLIGGRDAEAGDPVGEIEIFTP